MQGLREEVEGVLKGQGGGQWEGMWQAMKKVWASKWGERAFYSCRCQVDGSDHLMMVVVVVTVLRE